MKEFPIMIKGNNIKLTPALKDYVNEKIGRLTKYFEHLQSAEVELSCEDSRSADRSQKVEVTISANGTIFRCEEASVSMYASIDIAAEKLERQLRRYKERLCKKGRGPRVDKAKRFEPLPPEPEEDESEIVKTKRFSVKPMDPHEASLQMEMLNHSFFMFLNDQTEEINVIYKRRDGNYGLIEPELD
ncbi:MAG: ribosome-associated translation inhibitor RaiA [bacterium]